MPDLSNPELKCKLRQQKLSQGSILSFPKRNPNVVRIMAAHLQETSARRSLQRWNRKLGSKKKEQKEGVAELVLRVTSLIDPTMPTHASTSTFERSRTAIPVVRLSLPLSFPLPNSTQPPLPSAEHGCLPLSQRSLQLTELKLPVKPWRGTIDADKVPASVYIQSLSRACTTASDNAHRKLWAVSAMKLKEA